MAWENLRTLRGISHKAAHIPYKMPWEFKVEITGAPPDFEFFVKDFGVGDVNTETETEKAGGLTITVPSGLAPVQINMVMRDDEGESYSHYMKEWAASVFGPGGTFRLPTLYCKEVKLYRIISQDSQELPSAVYEMVYPTVVGETQHSYDGAGVLEFPVQLTQFLAQIAPWGKPTTPPRGAMRL